MAGIRTSISLIDKMSAILDRITGKNDRMKNSIERTQERMNRDTDFASNMSNAERKVEVLSLQMVNQQGIVRELTKKYEQAEDSTNKSAESMYRLRGQMLSAEMAEIKLAEATDKATTALKKQEEAENNIGGGVENATRKQRQFNSELNNGSGAADKLLGKIKGFAAAYLSFKAIKKGIQSTIFEAAELRKQSAVLEAAFGNKNIGKGYFKHLQNYAIETEHDISDLVGVTRDFMGMTKNTDKLRTLTDLANRLSVRTGNVNSAGSMMQEAMSGRFGNLQRTLHLDNSQLKPLKESIKKGSLEGIMEAFDSTFNTAGLTDSIVAAYQNTPLDKFEDIIARMKLKLAGVGEQALLTLDPVLSQINTWLQSDNAAMFFNTLAFGLDVVVQGFAYLSERIPLVTDAISQGFGFASEVAQGLGIVIHGLLPVILGVAAAWGVYSGIMLGVKAGTLAVTAAQNLYNLALKMNPIALVTAAIFGLAVAMDSMGLVTKGVREIFSDAFGFIVDIAEWSMNSVIKLINGGIRGINKVSGFFANLLGVDAKQIQEIEFQADFEKFKDKGQDLIENITLDDIKGKLGWDKFADPTTDAIDSFAEQEAMWNSMQQDTLGSLDDTGKKIKKSVDKSEEDLKWMRDMAEQEVINRFTTATLAPQITAHFGDVRETADIDGIITKITDVLVESVAIAAEGA